MISFKNFLNKLHEEAAKGPDEDFFKDAEDHVKYYAPSFTIAGEDGVTQTKEGPQKHAKGDFIAVGPENEQYPIKPDTFKKKYKITSMPEGDKPGTSSIPDGPPILVKAKQWTGSDTTITPAWGGNPLDLKTGDYAVRYGEGDYAPVGKDIFPKTYRKHQG